MEAVDRVFYGGKIRTLDNKKPLVEGLAVSRGRIVATGTSEEMLELAGPDTDRVDLQGKCVVPGFIDSHVHLGLCALTLGLMVPCHTPPCRSVDDILERLAEKARVTPPGEWIVGQGNLFQEYRLAEGRYPTRDELDAVSRKHPIVIRFGMHAQVLNSLALSESNITKDTPNPPGGHIDKDPKTGHPTGVIREMYSYIKLPEWSYEQLREALARVVHDYYLANGVTTIGEITDTTQSVRAIQELRREGRMPLRVGLYMYVPYTTSFEGLLRLGLQRDFGDEHVRLKGVKLFADGGVSGRAAALYEPYVDKPEHRGLLNYGDEELRRMVVEAHESGLQVVVHAVGDRGLDQALNAYAALGSSSRGARHRIEHFGNYFATSARIQKATELGVIGVPNPTFLHCFGDFVPRAIGPERAKRCFVFRDMINAGMVLSGNSDATGSHPEAINPFYGMWCAVNRRTLLGVHMDDGQHLTPEEALAMYTLGSAYALGEESEKGSLEPGKVADLVVVDRDPLSVDPSRLADVQVLETWIGGEKVYSKAGTGQ